VTAVLLAAVVFLACSTAYLLVGELRRRRTDAAITPAATRILFPFIGEALSTPAFDAALRIARAEGATLVPAYLAIVPLSVQIDTPLKKEATAALPLLEAIEQRAATQGVAVDSRIESGRSVRHAFRSLNEHERFDRVVAAGATNGDGFSAEDVAWLLEHSPGEILIVRPSREPGELPPPRALRGGWGSTNRKAPGTPRVRLRRGTERDPRTQPV
jgi:nucleotide-binding universal stress UspA family protein